MSFIEAPMKVMPRCCTQGGRWQGEMLNNGGMGEHAQGSMLEWGNTSPISLLTLPAVAAAGKDEKKTSRKRIKVKK